MNKANSIFDVMKYKELRPVEAKIMVILEANVEANEMILPRRRIGEHKT
jgi:hypothetical protein